MLTWSLQVAKNSRRPELPNGLPGPLVKLLKACWDQDPLNRPACPEILKELHQISSEFQQHKDTWESLYYVPKTEPLLTHTTSGETPLPPKPFTRRPPLGRKLTSMF